MPNIGSVKDVMIRIFIIDLLTDTAGTVTVPHESENWYSLWLKTAKNLLFFHDNSKLIVNKL